MNKSTASPPCMTPEKAKLAPLAAGFHDPNTLISGASEATSPRCLAVDANDAALVDHLLATGARPRLSDIGQLQQTASVFDSPNMLQTRAHWRLATDPGDTRSLMVYAALYGRQDNIEALLSLGFDINAPQIDGGKAHITSPSAAAMRGNQAMVNVMLQHGARITPDAREMASKHHVTPLG